jgi:hypothetical protein
MVLRVIVEFCIAYCGGERRKTMMGGWSGVRFGWEMIWMQDRVGIVLRDGLYLSR